MELRYLRQQAALSVCHPTVRDVKISTQTSSKVSYIFTWLQHLIPGLAVIPSQLQFISHSLYILTLFNGMYFVQRKIMLKNNVSPWVLKFYYNLFTFLKFHNYKIQQLITRVIITINTRKHTNFCFFLFITLDHQQ